MQLLSSHDDMIFEEMSEINFGEDLGDSEKAYIRWDDINFYAPIKTKKGEQRTDVRLEGGKLVKQILTD